MSFDLRLVGPERFSSRENLTTTSAFNWIFEVTPGAFESHFVSKERLDLRLLVPCAGEQNVLGRASSMSKATSYRIKLSVATQIPNAPRRQRAQPLGTVEAPDERSAEAAAVGQFGLSAEQRGRLVVQAEDDAE